MNQSAIQPLEDKGWPISWPSLNELLGPINHYIISVAVRSVLGATQAIIRFENDYGVSLFRDEESDNTFFEMTPLRFYGQRISDYEHSFNGFPFADLDWGYAQEDILDFCSRISLL